MDEYIDEPSADILGNLIEGDEDDIEEIIGSLEIDHEE